MELIELYGIKIKELTEILKDERVRKFEIKEYTNYIDYLIISFELNYEKKIVQYFFLFSFISIIIFCKSK